MRTLTPKQIVEAQEHNADMAANAAEAIIALIRHCIESDRPNEDHLLVLARDYKQQRDEEKVSRNMACIVRHAIDVKED